MPDPDLIESPSTNADKTTIAEVAKEKKIPITPHAQMRRRQSVESGQAPVTRSSRKRWVILSIASAAIAIILAIAYKYRPYEYVDISAFTVSTRSGGVYTLQTGDKAYVAAVAFYAANKKRGAELIKGDFFLKINGTIRGKSWEELWGVKPQTDCERVDALRLLWQMYEDNADLTFVDEWKAVKPVTIREIADLVSAMRDNTRWALPPEKIDAERWKKSRYNWNHAFTITEMEQKVDRLTQSWLEAGFSRQGKTTQRDRSQMEAEMDAARSELREYTKGLESIEDLVGRQSVVVKSDPYRESVDRMTDLRKQRDELAVKAKEPVVEILINERFDEDGDKGVYDGAIVRPRLQKCVLIAKPSDLTTSSVGIKSYVGRVAGLGERPYVLTESVRGPLGATVNKSKKYIETFEATYRDPEADLQQVVAQLVIVEKQIIAQFPDAPEAQAIRMRQQAEAEEAQQQKAQAEADRQRAEAVAAEQRRRDEANRQEQQRRDDEAKRIQLEKQAAADREREERRAMAQQRIAEIEPALPDLAAKLKTLEVAQNQIRSEVHKMELMRGMPVKVTVGSNGPPSVVRVQDLKPKDGYSVPLNGRAFVVFTEDGRSVEGMPCILIIPSDFHDFPDKDWRAYTPWKWSAAARRFRVATEEMPQAVTANATVLANGYVDAYRVEIPNSQQPSLPKDLQERYDAIESEIREASRKRFEIQNELKEKQAILAAP